MKVMNIALYPSQYRKPLCYRLYELYEGHEPLSEIVPSNVCAGDVFWGGFIKNPKVIFWKQHLHDRDIPVAEQKNIFPVSRRG